MDEAPGQAPCWSHLPIRKSEVQKTNSQLSTSTHQVRIQAAPLQHPHLLAEPRSHPPHPVKESKPRQKRGKTKKKKKDKEKGRSRRNKRKSKAVTGVVQTFKAKNVPKDRLTLDPGTKFGLYTRCRSSGPTKGKGLPDLVFSEMRFLQKPESPTKEEPDRKPKKKSQKKKGRQLSEREISKYFDVGATRSGDDNTGQRRHTPPLDISRVARDVQTASPVISVLLEKPFLGFGSRGSHPPTTSYYSWSESVKGSSARMAHFVQDLEPLAAGQLQSGRAQQRMEAVVLEQDTAQHPSAERMIPGQHNQNQDLIHEPAQEISQITRLPVKHQIDQGADTETKPIAISEKHENSAPAATTLVNQSERQRHSAKRTFSADKAMPTRPTANDNERCRTEPTQPELKVNPVKQYSEPWEELLQSCELAARPPVLTYYDEDLPRYNSLAINRQRPLDNYSHAGPPLWRADVDYLTEYDFPNSTAFMSEQVHWTQPVATEYHDDTAPFLEEMMMDEASESLDSQEDHELATEDASEWDIDDAERYDEIQDSQIRDGEIMDNFSVFWQPNSRRADPTTAKAADAAVFKSRTAQVARHLSATTRSSHNMSSPKYSVRSVGAPHTLEHRIFIEKDGQPCSPFHDIPLYANEQQTILNMVVEIPRWTNAKQEISKEETLNPIKQDTKKGKLRFVRNCFPHKGYLWNYGAFPQ
ncbi:hypothetical protein KCU95_g19509, partial [Aureobasidium melanogenum]